MKTLNILILIIFSINLLSQNHKSIHQIELEKHNKLGFSTEKEWNKYYGFKNTDKKLQKGCNLEKIVFGWHPYWAGSDYLNYQWSYLSDLAYFAYEVDYTNGGAVSLHNWQSSAVVDSAKSNNVRVHLTATLFGNHDAFFSNYTARENLIDNLITQVISRNAQGINIDFEGMGADNRDDFTEFIQNLSNELKSQVPDAMLSICLYAVDWSNVFDIENLEPYIDLYTIMGYDYYYSGSSKAGPTGQLYKFDTFNYTQSRTISYYLHKGAARHKLVLGIPYFGFEWQTENLSVPSNTIGSGDAITFEQVKNNSSGNYSNSQIEPNCLGKYYAYSDNGNNYQAWIEDSKTMKYSYKMVNQQDIGGIAIWALSYDDGYTEMWELIRDYFSDCAEIPLIDTIWDLGGPTRDHYNYESFVYTIKPTRGKDLTLDFIDFELEDNYDSLYIYDGQTIYDPLIGGYSGTNSPGTIIASDNALTLKFFSDIATVSSGWTAIWSSNADNENPTTEISAPDWNSNDFLASFNDNDNSQINNKFYQVIDFDGYQWRANTNFGFINDNFNQSDINSEWHSVSGSWSVTNDYLVQSNDALGNTNIYINAEQDSGKTYLYSWSMNLSGVAGNRRGGIHFFCDSASQTNRNDNYMVYFRADQDKVQIYKYKNNIYSLKTDNFCQINPDLWYDYKVLYNSSTGHIKAFCNDELVSEWIDPDNYVNGKSVSLRVGNAIGKFDDFKMYKSRTSNELVTVGTNADELRYENTDFSTSAGKILSIVTDKNNNFSNVYEKEINIDLSPPSDISYVNDGIGTDIDTTYSVSQLSANWSAATDDNSGISAYWYAIGSSPNNDDVYAWTKGNNQTYDTIMGLNLQYGNTYYFSVKAENLSGLLGNSTSSDGILVLLADEPPTADFIVSDNEICTGDSVTYYYTGMNGENFLWTFENANINSSTEMNPTVIYDNDGSFDVTLFVSNDFGDDQITKNDIITVHQTPFVDFAASPQSGTLPLLVEFENLSDNFGNNYLWDFGDGNIYENTNFEQFLQHIYTTTGIYNVSLTVETDYCQNYIEKNDYISVNYANLNDLNKYFFIYPNPVSNNLFIDNKLNKKFYFEIKNIYGNLVLKGNNKNKLNLSFFKPGIYFLKINIDDKTYIKKIIKQ